MRQKYERVTYRYNHGLWRCVLWCHGNGYFSGVLRSLFATVEMSQLLRVGCMLTVLIARAIPSLDSQLIKKYLCMTHLRDQEISLLVPLASVHTAAVTQLLQLAKIPNDSWAETCI